MVDPDLNLQPSDKAGAGHPDPKIRGWGRGAASKKIVRSFGPHFGLKIKGRPGPPGPSPGSATGLDNTFAPVDLINRSQSISGWSSSRNNMSHTLIWRQLFSCPLLPLLTLPPPHKKQQSNNGSWQWTLERRVVQTDDIYRTKLTTSYDQISY